MIKVINPATRETVKEYREHSLADVRQIISDAHRDFLEWRERPFAVRAGLMREAAGQLRENKEIYARLMTTEMGKLVGEARAEVEKCAWACQYYADNAERFLADEIIETEARKSFVAFEPLGVVFAVMPWNFPFWQVFRFAVPALMAGNAGVLKHASNVPGCALAIEDLFRKAGFPRNLFRSLLIASKEVQNVIRDGHITAVTLTGSEEAGKQVAMNAGQELKKTVLELGGSDAYVVLEDADIDQCVNTSVKARMINTGQSCIAAKRFIVVESIRQQFEEGHVALMESLMLGDPLNEATQVGPLARADLLYSLHEQVQKSLRLGAKLLCGGKQANLSGVFYEPTVLSDVKKGTPAYDDEIFGPVTAIIPVKDEDEAVRVANDTSFGLGASIWTRDVAKGERLARRIDAGCVFVNGMVKSDPRLPFGGVKRSGYGRELSHFGIKEFVNVKTVWIG